MVLPPPGSGARGPACPGSHGDPPEPQVHGLGWDGCGLGVPQVVCPGVGQARGPGLVVKLVSRLVSYRGLGHFPCSQGFSAHRDSGFISQGTGGPEESGLEMPAQCGQAGLHSWPQLPRGCVTDLTLPPPPLPPPLLRDFLPRGSRSRQGLRADDASGWGSPPGRLASAPGVGIGGEALADPSRGHPVLVAQTGNFWRGGGGGRQRMAGAEGRCRDRQGLGPSQQWGERLQSPLLAQRPSPRQVAGWLGPRFCPLL